MPEITRELLRKKSEHNESVLSTLEEISLHQLHIEKISMLDVYCRHLKILYLQDNLIEKMEGLNKLKELEYLNLAVNNVSLIEGIRGCESLQKIDLTLNFIDIEDLEESVDNLAELNDIRELYLIGNPMCDWPFWKDYFVARLPTLGRLDGEDVTKSWKLRAKQSLDEMQADLQIAAQKRIEKKVLEEKEPKNENAYSKEFRRECYREQVENEEKRQKDLKENSMFKEYNELIESEKNKGPPPVYNENGTVRQVNQGKYEWRYDETDDKTCVIFEIRVPKFMDTSHINVDLHPDYVRIDIKGRITQLSHPENIIVEKSKVQRSTTTGVLQLTMPKEKIDVIQAQNLRIKQRMEERQRAKKIRELEKKQELAKEEAEIAAMKKKEQSEKAMDLSNQNFIIRETELDDEKQKRLEERKKKFYEEFKIDFDINEVPPLE